MRLLIASLMVVAVGLAVPGPSAAAHHYDAPPIARVGVHGIGATEASSSQPRDARDGSARSPTGTRGTSTTPDAPVVATESVSAYDVGTYDDLTRRSVKGDGIEIHHPMQDHASQQLIDEASYGGGPAIALPRAEHRRIRNLKGEVTITPVRFSHEMPGTSAATRTRRTAPSRT